MSEILHVLYDSRLVGHLRYDRKRDEVSFEYEEAWQFGAESFPMSLSLQLVRKTHADGALRPFLQGLLPDNPAVLEAWGKRFRISPRNPFDVIKQVGEDCAGALQFVRPERVELIRSGELDALIPLSEDDLENRLRDLNLQAHAIPVQMEGRFSLAGAQSKDALHFRDGRWCVPCGRIPSTHILKPELEEFPHHALNEDFCLRLASQIGLQRANSHVMEIGRTKVLCVKRYDRVRDPRSGHYSRIHQEDVCQALNRYPGEKYQSDGGPSAAEVVALLSRFSDEGTEDVDRFVMALALNWVIAGTDAHSKNYSLLHAAGSYLRLAPLYDLASYLPYQRDRNSTKVKLAMKIGGTYRLHQIDGHHWRAWAGEAGLSEKRVLAAVGVIVDRVRDGVRTVREEMTSGEDRFLSLLADAIRQRAEKCARALS